MNITRLRPLKPIASSTADSVQAAGSCCRTKKLEASALLAEVLAQLHEVDRPILQFMPAGSTGPGTQMAHDFAAAAIDRFGRILLLDSGMECSSSQEVLLPRRGNQKARRSSVVPNTQIAGLYHGHISDASIQSIAADAKDLSRFRMILLQDAAPVTCPGSLDRSRHCHGTIMTVAAGRTRLPEVQATARQIGQAGGRLLGVVLYDAPVMQMPFRKSFRP